MKVLLITPPFTQTNTPYPATMYLKGFLNSIQVDSYQVDLSIEVMLEILNSKALSIIFDDVEAKELELSPDAYSVFIQREKYIKQIDILISFLQGKDNTLIHHFNKLNNLPKGRRLQAGIKQSSLFSIVDTTDRAKYFATLMLEDLVDFIQETTDVHFGISKYAERLSKTSSSFDILYMELRNYQTFVTDVIKEKITTIIEREQPNLVCITAPFPGNVFAAFLCARYIKESNPSIKICFGGGYVNTELRSIYDSRVFEFFDFITLDDGEAPLQHIIQYLENLRPLKDLKRTYLLQNNVVSYINGSNEFDIPQAETGTPDYRDLDLKQYISGIDLINPMHRLWSDGRWNKLTLAHGCYWGKCSFCDISLDYIKRYEPITANVIVDRIEEIIKVTGEKGFHFVDEAAPPALMREVAIEIIKRELTITWWTNIRFEKSFTPDLCRLLSASGCIAITGGLEVASDRLLAKMKKGVTIAQVANVAASFTENNIMVHAYLMYGFPTQNDQETIDSMEVVRQLLLVGAIQSGFWHQFAMTAHSPVGLAPQEFQVVHDGPEFEGFAENDYFHLDPTGADHEKYSEGLSNSLSNYMQGIGFDLPLQSWFDFRIPKTSIPKGFIQTIIESRSEEVLRDTDKIFWVGGKIVELVEYEHIDEQTMLPTEYAELIFYTDGNEISVKMPISEAYFMAEWIPRFEIVIDNPNIVLRQWKVEFVNYGLDEFDIWIQKDYLLTIRSLGLIFV